ncbi:putative gustatory receptor 2a isoform X2 [Aedes aegypti]|uniref:Gustatory receptor n=2 Tax=Aedes aegypti TaxID=7159 RepID=A0A6I8U2C9_AEDAE|nr:putative gustatory receptor 2a isoform X2 [Aedes aegypti]
MNIVVISTVGAFAGSIFLLIIYLIFAAGTINIEYIFETMYFNMLFSMTCVYALSVSYLLLRRFCMVNLALSTHFPSVIPLEDGTLPKKVYNARYTEKQHESLTKIKIVVDKLNDTTSLTNQCFALQVLYCVGVSFVIGIVCSFYLFRAVIYRNDQLAMGAINFIWYMYYLSFVLFFIAIGSRISQEGRRIGITVHKAINFCNTSGTVINELIIFSQQLLHHNPVITCGLFVYDWSLLYTMLGATATYLIILIQFDVSFPSLDVGNSTTSSL